VSVTLSACVYQTGRQLSTYSFLIRDSFSRASLARVSTMRYVYRSPVSYGRFEKLRSALKDEISIV